MNAKKLLKLILVLATILPLEKSFSNSTSKRTTINENHSLAESTGLSVINILKWKYQNETRSILLAQNKETTHPKICLVYEKSISDENLIFGSDIHQSCKFAGAPKIINNKNYILINFPTQVDASGEDKNYDSAGINLLFDKTRKRLCSPVAAAESPWVCRKTVSSQFYKELQ